MPRPRTNYSNRRKPAGESQQRRLHVAVIIVVIGIVITAAVFAVSNWLGPFPFGINRRDTTLLTLWNEGKCDDVLSQAEVVLVEKPLDAQALTFGGFAHFYVGIDLATSAEKQEHLSRSIILLRKAEHVEHVPLEGERRYVLAKAYYHTGAGNFDLSARYMGQSIADGYVADDSHSYLGLAAEGMGDYSGSALWYEQGLLLRDSAALRMKAADARIALEEFDVAEDHLRTALDRNSDEYLDLVLEINLAAILIMRDHLTLAEGMLVDIDENHPDSADAFYYLGVVYENTDRSIEARGMWRHAREIDPDHLKALESLANWEE